MALFLGLSSDRAAKIEPILADRDQRVQDVRSNTNLAPSDRKAQLLTQNTSYPQPAAVTVLYALDSNSPIAAIPQYATDAVSTRQTRLAAGSGMPKKQQGQSGVSTNS